MGIPLLVIVVALLSTPTTSGPAPGPSTAMCRPIQPEHGPILIVGNADFTTANGVGRGTGIPLDPYRIEHWYVATGAAHGIEVKNTTAHFLIRDILACGVPPYLHDGVRFDNVTNARIESFDSIYNGAHIRILKSTNIAIDRVGFTGRQVPWEQGTITGIHVEDSRFVNMTRVNTRWDGQLTTGVSLLQSQDILIEDSNLGYTANAIAFSSSSGVTIRRVEVGGGNGIVSGSSSDVRIENTRFLSCLGLRLAAARDVAILGSTFANNADALVLEGATNVMVDGNSFQPGKGTEYMAGGIAATNSRDVVVVRNTFGPVYHGVRLTSTTNASVHHNEFQGPRVPAYDERGPENRWDDGYPSGGNHWSDYAGVDEMSGPNQDLPGPDGIGDTPYVIDGDSRDRYPILNSGLRPDSGALEPGPAGFEALPSTTAQLTWRGEGTVARNLSAPEPRIPETTVPSCARQKVK